MTTQTKHFRDLRFTVVAEEHDGRRVNFTIHEICGNYPPSPDSPEGQVLWTLAGSDSGEHTETLELAETFLSGTIRCNGDCVWEFKGSDPGHIEFGSRDAGLNIGKIMAECWDMAVALLPKFYG